MSAPRGVGPAVWGTIAGVAGAGVACVWLTAVLLTGPGATSRVLLVALLFVLPLLGIGALAGRLAGLAVEQVARVARRRHV